MSYNEIKDISPILQLKELKILHFNCGITDSIMPLLAHPKVEKISLCDSSIGENNDIGNHEIEVFRKFNKKCKIITSWEELWE